MPVVSRFLGIVIRMYYEEHGPPHFHAVYGEHKVSIDVQSGTTRGTFPSRALRHARESAAIHQAELLISQAELLISWELARQRKRLGRIAPLE